MASRAPRTSLFLSLVLTACSGAVDNGDLFGAPATPNQAGATDPSANNPAPDQTAVPGSGTTGTGVAPPSPGPGVDPATPSCALEAEPNDEKSKANAFTSSFCGKINGEDDEDFARFVPPAGARHMDFVHQENGGKLNYKFYLEGVPVSDGNGDHLPPVVADATYYVQVRLANKGDQKPSYQMTVTFK